jgi:two-component system sensor histidine kinase DesK
MRDVEDVARRTLLDVRLASRGYRTTLVEEVDRSRSMLKTGRIAAEFDIAPLDLPQPGEETLALALREAVTNVVRHAHATRCCVRLARTVDQLQLEVEDDGRGADGAPGLGLRGMRERVESMGGSLRVEGGAGTRVVIVLPAEDGAGTRTDVVRAS